jgi:hypothetical protein
LIDIFIGIVIMDKLGDEELREYRNAAEICGLKITNAPMKHSDKNAKRKEVQKKVKQFYSSN